MGDTAVSISPPDADSGVSAVIVAAVETYLSRREAAIAAAAAAKSSPDQSWRGRRWAITGRITAVRSGREGANAIRPRSGAPPDAWTLAGRVDHRSDREGSDVQ